MKVYNLCSFVAIAIVRDSQGRHVKCMFKSELRVVPPYSIGDSIRGKVSTP